MDWNSFGFASLLWQRRLQALRIMTTFNPPRVRQRVEANAEQRAKAPAEQRVETSAYSK